MLHHKVRYQSLKLQPESTFHQFHLSIFRLLPGLPLPSFPEHKVRVQYATEHRCGVAVSGPNLSDAITGLWLYCELCHSSQLESWHSSVTCVRQGSLPVFPLGRPRATPPPNRAHKLPTQFKAPDT